MKVRIPCEFEVETDDPDVARDAAQLAAEHHLSLCSVIDINPGREVMEVHVEGEGRVVVRIGDDHG